MPLDTSIPVSGLTYNGQAFQLAGGEEPNLETKTVTLEAGTTEITPSSGYDGMEKVIATVEVEPVKLQTKDVEVYLGTTEIVPSYGYDGIAKVNVTARANLYMKTVTLDRGITEIYPPDGADGLNKVLAIVEPSTLPDEYVCKELMLFEAPESGKRCWWKQNHVPIHKRSDGCGDMPRFCTLRKSERSIRSYLIIGKLSHVS